MRNFIIPEKFFKSIAEKGKLYSRIWFYWLSEFVDEIFEPDFLEKQQKAFPKVSEIKDVYVFGVQLLQQDFKIVNAKKREIKIVPKEHKKIAAEVIEYLNSKANTTYTTLGNNTSLISDRLKEGYTISDFKIVIDKKVNDWSDCDYAKYLRPITLFNKTKFENYLNGTIKKPSNSFTKFAKSIEEAQAIIGFHTK